MYAAAPHVQALPSHVPLPNTFTNEELDLLEDKRHAMAANKRKRRDRRRLKKVVAPAVAKAVDGATPGEIASATSLESYLWALNLVGSRALTIRGRKYLVPFADMFNYEPHGDTRDADSGANFLKYHKLGEKTFDIVADRAASAGEQLFEDYGDNGNELYLNHHGFVAANNPFDCVRLQLPPILPRHVLQVPRWHCRWQLTTHLLVVGCCAAMLCYVVLQARPAGAGQTHPTEGHASGCAVDRHMQPRKPADLVPCPRVPCSGCHGRAHHREMPRHH